ncbi:MAG: exosortase E/protease, system [Candidatus Saccharibacteria bacterium]|nr:exosortase E/protease, system [Candidatus Saccharibacteria bacterium]
MKVTQRRFIVFIIGFFGIWISSWLVHEGLWQMGLPMPVGTTENLVYWTVAKLLVWVVYPLLYWRAPLREQLKFIGVRRPGPGMVWGVGATAAWLALSAVLMVMSGRYLGSDVNVPIFIYSVLLTPVFEEVMFRGYIQSALRAQNIRFAYVNMAAAGLFVLIHCVGWSFQGTLMNNLVSVVPALFCLSLIFGYIRERSGSLLAPIILHIGNNGFASLLRY